MCIRLLAAFIAAERDQYMPTLPHGVLVVEDDIQTRKLMTMIFELEKVMVYPAASGHEAIQFLMGSAVLPAVILLDLDLPDMTGEEVVIALRQREDWADIPVVLVSAAPRLAQIARQLGVAGYVTKPFGPAQLIAAVHQYARVDPDTS